jgi:hypothetical protein
MTIEPTNRSLYTLFAEQLPRDSEYQSRPEVDGRYWQADLYSSRIDDGVLDAIREVARVHLNGGKLHTTASPSLSFLSRLRCVDSLSDYLMSALQTVTERKAYTVEGIDRAILPAGAKDRPTLPAEESGYLYAGQEMSVQVPTVSLVHISDLIAHDKLTLSIPSSRFSLETTVPIDPTQPCPMSGSATSGLPASPDYCFVSHSWIDKCKPDTEDGKFYRVLLLMALDVFLEKGH